MRSSEALSGGRHLLGRSERRCPGQHNGKMLFVATLGRRCLNRDLDLTVVLVGERRETPEPIGVDTRSRVK